ncbi:MAG: hypothetical protein AB8B93_12860 [Pseudomonadales bacterium]
MANVELKDLDQNQTLSARAMRSSSGGYFGNPSRSTSHMLALQSLLTRRYTVNPYSTARYNVNPYSGSRYNVNPYSTARYATGTTRLFFS